MNVLSASKNVVAGLSTRFFNGNTAKTLKPLVGQRANQLIARAPNTDTRPFRLLSTEKIGQTSTNQFNQSKTQSSNGGHNLQDCGLLHSGVFTLEARILLAASEDTPPEAIKILSSDSNSSVRFLASLNKNNPNARAFALISMTSKANNCLRNQIHQNYPAATESEKLQAAAEVAMQLKEQSLTHLKLALADIPFHHPKKSES